MFTIKSLIAKTHDTSYGGYKWKVVAVVEMPAAEFNKVKKSKQLGFLYCIDISKAIYRYNNNIYTYNPSVDGSKRASKGIKTIVLTYYTNDADRAFKLGLNVRLARDGTAYAQYGDYVDLMQKPKRCAEVITNV